MEKERLQLDKILKTLEELKEAKEPKSKDSWDKAGILGQLIAGVVLVALGLYLTWSINNAQQNLARTVAEAQIKSSEQVAMSQRQSSLDIAETQVKTSKDIADAQAKNSLNIAEAQVENSKAITDAQLRNSRAIADAQTASQQFAQQLNLDATNRQIASDYLGKLITTSQPYDRAALLNALDITLGPNYSVPLVLRLSRPVQLRADICRGVVKDDDSLKQQAIVSTAATAMLQRLKTEGPEQLRQISRSGHQLEASLADAILREDSRVLFRVSAIDDFADVFINNTQLPRFEFGHESGWVDVTSRMIPNRDNRISVLVSNSNAEGTGVRFEVRAGAEQFDRLVIRHDWTGEGPSFWILFSLSVDDAGRFHLNGDSIQVLVPERGEHHC
jgi:hypothetical protein